MTRRGIAMLLVLATLVLVMTALAGTVMAIASRTRAAVMNDADQRADDLLFASETITNRWLRRDASRAVKPADHRTPRVPIAAIHLQEDTSLQMAAWDLTAMVPADAPRFNPLWRAVPDKHRTRSIGDATLRDLSVFGDPVHPVYRADSRPRLGDFVAFAPAAQGRRSGTSTPVININTAPERLLRIALATAQRGDLASIMESRSRRVPAPAPTGSDTNSGLVHLTARSNLWAVRVDVTVGRLTRSWWTVYTARGRGWQILERYEIAE